MKVRKILDGDYCLGHGNKELLSDSPETVAQNVMTRLALWQGSWFANLSSGTPWMQQILGKRDLAEALIKSRILETDGVLQILEFQSIFNPDERRISISAVIETIYGQTTLEGTINGN